MNKLRKLMLPALIFLLGVFLVGCGTKDLVSLTGMEKKELYVGDRFGNKIKVENPGDFVQALKAAKAVKDAKGIKSETEADYVLYADDDKIYYDAQGKYLTYVDKSGKKHFYSLDLSALLSKVPGLPPTISAGFSDAEVSKWLDDLTKIKEPAAMLFDRGDKAILVVSAGEKPTGGYSLNLEEVTMSNGALTLNLRLNPPKDSAVQAISYPYAAFTLSRKADLDVRLIVAAKDGDQVFHVPVAQVAKDQNIILLRPERGSILTERVKMVGFARVYEGTFSVEVEDGHNVLGVKTVTASKSAPDWGYFEFWIDLEQATSPYGSIIFVTKSAKDGSRVEELNVPISFGGK